jgi:hypothetical protein
MMSLEIDLACRACTTFFSFGLVYVFLFNLGRWLFFLILFLSIKSSFSYLSVLCHRLSRKKSQRPVGNHFPSFFIFFIFYFFLREMLKLLLVSF